LGDASNETEIRYEISEALSPITLQMMKIPATEFVATMDDNIVNWLADSAIAWAGMNDTATKNELKTCEPIIEYVPVPIQIEKCS
jgi:hypothetical protein